MATEIGVNIGSSNGSLPDGTKPLPEPMLIYHHLGPMYSSEDNFTRDTSTSNNWDQHENYVSKISFESPRGQWVRRDENSQVIMAMYPIRHTQYTWFCCVMFCFGCIMNAYFVCCLFSHILQGCFAGIGASVWLSYDPPSPVSVK